jgi:hypothetical protein
MAGHPVVMSQSRMQMRKRDSMRNQRFCDGRVATGGIKHEAATS